MVGFLLLLVCLISIPVLLCVFCVLYYSVCAFSCIPLIYSVFLGCSHFTNIGNYDTEHVNLNINFYDTSNEIFDIYVKSKSKLRRNQQGFEDAVVREAEDQ